MRRALSIGLLLLASLLARPAQAQAPVSRFPKVNLFGTDYIRLDDWARVNGYSLAWITPRKDLRVSNSNGALQFTVDARRMTLRGVTVWLSHPVAWRNGSAHVAALDFATAIHPVLFPSRNPSSRSVRTIVLDPGHGGKDPGNQEGKQKEKEFTLLLARETRDLLAKAGFNVSLTRDKDSFLELPSRPALASRRRADLFVSLHFNSVGRSGGSAVKGAEVYCMTPVRASSTNARGEGAGAGASAGNRADQRNMLLAFHIQKALAGAARMEDRGVKRARFAVLRDADMPAVLIEAGFMSHPGDALKISEPNQRRRLAQAIAEGIIAYRRTVDGR